MGVFFCAQNRYAAIPRTPQDGLPDCCFDALYSVAVCFAALRGNSDAGRRMSGPNLRLISSSGVNGALVARVSVCLSATGASFTSTDGRSSVESRRNVDVRKRGVVS
jgi:hypothetical protein